MCGIAGIISYSTDASVVNPIELDRIRDSMQTRGPDGKGSWISSDKRIGLAHRRLSIIDLTEAGNQPMVDKYHKLVITFNGEIYNYRQLRKKLISLGHQFKSNSDTEVILKLYIVYGERLLEHLRGMFCFAIWDENTRKVFIARDQFGIKPLYILDNGKEIRFASQVKSLVAGSNINLTDDPAGHVGFFLWGHIPEPYTIYRNIRALPTGCSLTVSMDKGTTQNQYFSITTEIKKLMEKPHNYSSADSIELLRNALKKSVARHMVADVPVGVFLSAGLDSSTLTALASQSDHTEQLDTITLGFEEYANTADDEVSIAEELAVYYGTNQHTKWVKKEDFSSHYDQLMHSMDQPSIDGVNSYFVCRAAKLAGLKVVLSGLGGDELFGGYSSFKQLPQLTSVFSFLKSIPHIGKSFRHLLAPIFQKVTSPKYASIIEYGSSIPEAYFLRRGLYMPWELNSFLDNDLVVEGLQQLNTLQQLSESINSIPTDRLKISALELSWYMRNQLLRDCDWASMAHSLELRVPLVDVDLFRTVINLILSNHIIGKLDMATSPEKQLPPHVLNRPKTGFSIPVREWLLLNSTNQTNGNERGLRSWAKLIYRQQTGHKV